YGPFRPGFWWFFLKVAALLFLYLWVRFTFPRFRYDQLMNLCWKYLIPLGILNLIWVTALKLWVF
ncbi:MAG: NADH-quinone oxidoreductase subunit H, partial [Candidatus Hydrothermae bacterium]|nr:NADH-quinone oxidoreductase subunit H [Candidatus Hydrothermae bacterium]